MKHVCDHGHHHLLRGKFVFWFLKLQRREKEGGTQNSKKISKVSVYDDEREQFPVDVGLRFC